jgi:hypothetical protein
MIFNRPNVKALMEFEGADLFGQDGDETFSCSDPIEAIEQVLEGIGQYEDIRRWLRGPGVYLPIGAYKRGQVSEAWVTRQSEAATEFIRENFCEEHGDLDGEDRLSDADAKELEQRMHAVVSWYITKAKVFSCEQLRLFALDSDDLLELVQQLHPEWLEAE